MFNKILEAMAGTPWWAWVALFYVISIGILNLKTRVRQLYTIFILPTIFLVMFLQSLISNFGFSFYPWLIWLIALFAGLNLGWFLFINIQIKADRKKQLIKIPGSPATLILVLLVFAVKYFFGYTQAVNPEFAQSLFFVNSKLISSGCIEGIFIGRVLFYLNKYFSVESEDL
ncbi:MAG: DUF6622 family protein [bacterium]